ncbi:MAG: hypothetical protein WB699_11870 [Bacteroidota bacterium]
MADILKDPSPKSTPEIRIVGLNADKTRKTPGSYTLHQVHFELSGNPPLAWRDIFGREWNDLDRAQEAGVDGRFLVICCPIQEVATIHLPVLKKAVEATNIAYKQHVREQAREEVRKNGVWKQDRKAVEDVAKALEFE